MRQLLCVVSYVWLMLLLMTTDASAQAVSWGLKGGVPFASLHDSPFDTSADAGAVVGGFVGIDLGPVVRLQPEVLWSMRRFSATGVPTSFAVSTRGVETPVLLQIRVPKGRPTQAILFLGPHFAFVGRVTQKVGRTVTRISDQIRDHDAGIVIGAGVERNAGGGAFMADVRAVIGMRPLSEAPGGTFESRAIHLLGGYRF